MRQLVCEGSTGGSWPRESTSPADELSTLSLSRENLAVSIPGGMVYRGQTQCGLIRSSQQL